MQAGQGAQSWPCSPQNQHQPLCRGRWGPVGGPDGNTRGWAHRRVRAREDAACLIASGLGLFGPLCRLDREPGPLVFADGVLAQVPCLDSGVVNKSPSISDLRVCPEPDQRDGARGGGARECPAAAHCHVGEGQAAPAAADRATAGHGGAGAKSSLGSGPCWGRGGPCWEASLQEALSSLWLPPVGVGQKASSSYLAAASPPSSSRWPWF